MYAEYFPVFADLVHRLGLVALISMAYGSIIRAFNLPWTRGLMVGLLFGGAAIISMLDPVIVDDGIIVDARSILLALSAPFGGVVAVLVSTALTILSRVLIGGVGVQAGVVGIVIIGLISLIFTLVYRPQTYSWKHFLILGLTVPLYTLSIFILPFEQEIEDLRPGDCHPARPDRAGRAGIGAGCFRAGANPQSPARSAGGNRRVLSLHFSRSCRGSGRGRPHDRAG